MCLASVILAAIAIEYAPASSNEYYFGQCPNEARYQFPTNRYRWTGWDDRRNSRVMFNNDKVLPIGAVRRCPISGEPFSSRLPKHEDLAWILEACEERRAVAYNNQSTYYHTWTLDHYFYYKPFFTEPDFGFTNLYYKHSPIPFNPNVENIGMTENAWYYISNKAKYVGEHFGGDCSYVDPLPYVPSGNVISNGTMKLSDFEPIVTAIQSFPTGDVAAVFDYMAMSNRWRKVDSNNVGTYSDGTWSMHNYTQTVKEYHDQPSVSTNNNWGFSCQYGMSSHKERNFHPSSWDDDKGMYTSLTEDSPTGHTTEHTEYNLGGYAHAQFYACTNNLIAGGHNRLADYQLYIVFELYEYGSYVAKTNYIAVIPYDGGSHVRYGEELKSLPSADEWLDGDVVLELDDLPDSMYEDAFAACGLQWKRRVEATEPQKMTYDDIDKYKSVSYHSYSSTYITQGINVLGAFLFHRVSFRMK